MRRARVGEPLLLSRLQRTIEKADVPNDYGTTWGALFLSPLTGALTAWGGALLIILGVKLSILGAALTLEWNYPYDPTALAIALAFGFSERWFSGILDTVESNRDSCRIFFDFHNCPRTKDHVNRSPKSHPGKRE
jgi:hypothetical protein